MLGSEFMPLMQKLYNHPRFNKNRNLSWFDNAILSAVRIPPDEPIAGFDAERVLAHLKELGEGLA